jgi:ABC-2 type transport system permease protein
VNFGRFLATARAQLQMTFRRRVTLFWSLFFPIILMGALGLLFGGQLNAGKVAVVPVDARAPKAVVRMLEHTKGVTVERAATRAEAVKDVRGGSRDAAVVFTRAANGTYVTRLYTSNTSADQAGIIRGIVLGATDGVAMATTGSPPAVRFESRSVDSSSLTYVDFLVPGVIALSIMNSAVIGLATIMVDWRQRGILRRLKLTPIPLAEFFAARVTASLTVAAMQVVVLLAFGRLVFDVRLDSTAWAAVPIALAGCLCFLALGFAIGSFVSTPETGDAVSQVFTLPMMFLSGTFLPVAAMPGFVQGVAHAMPLYYMANGLRDTTVRGLSITHVAPDIGVLLGVTAILSVIALRSFRWEPSI